MKVTLLTVVDETFAISQRGVIVAPDVDLGDGPARTLVVELRRPDGSVARSEARAEVPFVHPPRSRPARHVLRFATLSKDDLPRGTEIG
jgi:hypothetical protein